MAVRLGSAYIRVVPGAITAAGPLFWAGGTILGFLLLRFGPGRLSYRHAMVAVAAPFPMGVATLIVQDMNTGRVQSLRKQGMSPLLLSSNT